MNEIRNYLEVPTTNSSLAKVRKQARYEQNINICNITFQLCRTQARHLKMKIGNLSNLSYSNAQTDNNTLRVTTEQLIRQLGGSIFNYFVVINCNSGNYPH